MNTISELCTSSCLGLPKALEPQDLIFSKKKTEQEHEDKELPSHQERKEYLTIAKYLTQAIELK